MPSPKSGTAGTIVTPTDAGVAVDAIDAQPGSTETAPAAGTDRGTETMTLGSVSAGDESASDDSDSDDDSA